MGTSRRRGGREDCGRIPRAKKTHLGQRARRIDCRRICGAPPSKHWQALPPCERLEARSTHRRKPKRWSSDEDKALFALIRQHETEHGVDWKPIVAGMAAAGYESRTSSCCRNRFLRYKRGKREVDKGLDMNMNICHLCGQLRKGHICTGIFNVASDGLRREV